MSDIVTYKEVIPKEVETENLNDEVYVFPVSYAQKRMWFLDQFEPGSPYYNIPNAFRLKGELNIQVFKRVIYEITRRHESIRTTFSTQDREPVQIILPNLKILIPLIDLSDLKHEVKEKTIQTLAINEARTPFDLKIGPLFRVSIIRVGLLDHVILLTMHHIISDGWSMNVLVGEITRLYSAFIQNKPSPLPKLSIQYADYAEWQNEYFQGEFAQQQLNYWKKQLGGQPPVLELPTDNPRPAVWTNEGANYSIIIPKQITKRLQEFNRREGVTFFMSTLSVFFSLLYRYTGQEDITVGTPIANRTRNEIEGLIGIFINTLVLRVNLEDDPSFHELVNRVKQVTLGAFDNQDLPFEMLVEALQPERDMSYPPLFQALFIVQNAPVSGQLLPGLKLSMLDIDMGTSTHDLTFSLAEGEEGISVSVEYNTDLFSKSTIVRFLKHFQTLLDQSLLHPEIPIYSLSILNEMEKRQILIDWNQVKKEIPPNVCIHHLFEKEAEASKDIIAVFCQGESISYQDLNSKANQLAHYLQKKGVKLEIPIGIYLEKSVPLMIAVLGVLKANGAYLPLDPSYPQDRLAYMLKDAGISVLITQSTLIDDLPSFDGKVICIDSDWHQISQENVENPGLWLNPENAAYIIYTSGSTGKSKGTIVRHRGLVNAYFAWEDAFELRTHAKSHLQMASFSFDVFSGDWVRALCSGGKLILVPRDMLLQSENLYQLMVDQKVTIGEFVPAVLRNLILFLKESDKKLDFFRVLIAGSDVWYMNEYRQLKQFCGPNTRLINSFGLTEATIDSSYFETGSLEIAGERLVPIGRPFANMPLYILDRNFEPVPIGVHGELFVGGEGVARGYLNRNGLTGEKFIPNPFSAKAGDRFYRTGDMARFLPDGNIEFLGRIDQQVKIRGYRIELGEIETVLTQHSAVKDVAVIAREDSPGDKKLVAYLTLDEDKKPNQTDLRDLLLSKLPDYMVPSAFVFLDELPLTPNGKVDRRALPAPDQDQILQGFEQDFIAPRTPVEDMICEIWSEILQIDKIGVYHNFFILGGHSLLATQVISRIKETFLVDVPLRSIFENPTVAGLARAVDSAKLSEKGLEAPPIEHIPRDQNLPLSFSQQRLWFLDQMEPNSPFYNIPEIYRIRGVLDVFKLEQSFNEVIKRHETLRTTFHSNNGSPFIKIEQDLEITLNIVDLSEFNEKEERETRVKEIIAEDSQKPIPLSQLPLFRISVIKLGSEDHIILMTIHHIISDNWSTTIFIQEVAVLYDSYSRNLPSPLPELPIQYVDFAAWQRNWFQGEIFNEQINYWKTQLKGAPPVLELPFDRPRPAIQTFNGDYHTFELPKELSEALNQLCRDEGVTLFMTLLAIYQTLLFRYSGQDDISIGTPIANRNRAEIESLIGFFVNTLVLRTDLSGDPSFRELLHRVKEVALGAYAHQDLPFEYLVDAIQPERNLSHSPLFQVMFALQNTQNQMKEIPSGLTLESVEGHSGTSKFDLTLFMGGTGNHLGGAFEYNSDLFETDTIARMCNHFQLLLEKFVKNPDLPISAISLLTEVKQKEILINYNKTDEISIIDGFLHQVFEHQVQKTPNNVAAIYKDQKLSYSELNKKSNQLAHFLRKLDVGPDVVVGISIERSFELLVGLFGILKAGGAYLPLDSNSPPERIKYLLQDSEVKILLTQKDYLDRFPVEHVQTICLDLEWQEKWNESDHNLENFVSEDNLAYVIYTSGSTGKPKGTLITHKGMQNYLSWCLHAYPVHQGQGSIVHSTIAFDATVTAIFPSLLTGKPITFLPEKSDLEELSKTLEANKNYSVVKITPAHLEILSNQLSPESADQLAKALIIGGENLTSDQIEFWRKHSPSTLLFNEYGPTETVVGCVVFEASKWNGKNSVPIGKVIPNVSIYVLDSHLQPVPVGIPGELYIGGVGVARGYLKRPDLTAKRFIPNPFTNNPGNRLYKTGDLVRFKKDENLEFLRRIDDQVKIRGYRIELGEVETALENHPSIENVVVVIRDEKKNNPSLVAYFVKSEDAEIEKTELREFLQNKLPEYMIPSAFVCLDKIPLTPNGKVDRNKLPEPKIDRSSPEYEYIAPTTQTEIKLTEIWSEVLQVEKIGIYDNFFHLGGQSLLITKVVSRIREQFEIDLSIRSIFDNPTISGLAQKVDSASQFQMINKAPVIEKIDRTKKVSLSFSQHRLWFLDKLDPGKSVYNMPSALRLQGKLDFSAFEKSLRKIIERHETLRTIFSDHDGEPYQNILDEIKVPLSIIDISEIPETVKEEVALQVVQADALAPFDLSGGPLIRVLFIKIANDDQAILFTMHHIISDGWSVNLFMQEFAQNYTSFKKERELQVPPLSIQYADYASWQRSWLRGEVLEKQLAYWKRKLKDVSPLLELPLDKPRPPVKTFQASHASFLLPEDLCDRLRDLANAEKVTSFMLLLSAFQVILYRYSHQKDFCVGSPISGRNSVETEGVIGFFANTLSLRTPLEDNLSIRDLLKRVRETALEAYAHQDIPFEKIIETLQLDRDLSYTPLFQVMFVLQNTQLPTPDFSELNLLPLDYESSATQFDLTLSMEEGNDRWGGTFEYNVDLFNSSTIQRMISHFQLLLRNIVENPNTLISEINILTFSEEHQLLVKWNDTQEFFQIDRCIHELFEEQVERTPDAIAIEFDNGGLTYSELNQQSNKLARFLRKKGVGPEVIIGVSVERSTEMIIALLGILKAGGAYLPIDPDLPSERIRYMVDDASIKLLLTKSQFIDNLSNNHVQTVCLDTEWNNIEAETPKNLSNLTSSQNLCYMIYTSGSTGKPKGSLLQHKGLCNLVQAQVRDFSIYYKSRVLQFASLGFDASVSEIFTTLITGATLVLVRKEIIMSTMDLPKFLQDKKISVVTLPPSVLSMLPAEGFPCLKSLISAGEPCSKEIAKRWSKGRHFINAYGPTESTVGVSCYFIDHIPQIGNSIPIGKACANIELFILDTKMNPVPIGVAGEIYIGGAGLARGYHQQFSLTAEKFVPNPFAGKPGERLYRTGDLARFLPDGNIEYLGRIDFQVKVRGFRIELGEIETAIRNHPSIKDAVVLVRTEQISRNQNILAFLIVEENKTAKPQEMKKFLKQKLPDYMIPTAFITLDKFPLTPNAKVDRKTLEKYEIVSGIDVAEYVAPRNPIEEILGSIFSQLLPVEKVGIHDNFFNIGGHSLLATQVNSRIRDAFNIELPLMILFEHPTIGELARNIQEIVEKQQGLMPPRITRVSRDQDIPLSFSQQRLWFLNRLDPENTSHNIPIALQVKGNINIEMLVKSFKEVVRKHEILRTNFTLKDEEPVQIIYQDYDFEIRQTDLRYLNVADKKNKLKKILSKEATYNFNLEKDQLLRVCIIQLSSSSCVISLVLHHIITDGWSINILVREVVTNFSTMLSGKDQDFSAPEIQFADFSCWQREWLKDEILEEQLSYWKNKLQNASPLLELTTDKPRPNIKTFNGAREAFVLEQEFNRKINEFCQKFNVTPFMFLLSVFKTLLYRYSGQKDILIGTPIANRNRIETENILGFFANTLVLRTDYSNNPGFIELLSQIRKTTLNAFNHQDIPFEKIVETVQPERALSHSPLFQVMFVMQNIPVQSFEMPDIQIKPIESDSKVVQFDLTLSMEETQEGFTGWLEYNTDLYFRNTIQNMIKHFQILLKNILENPKKRLSEFQVLDYKEQSLQLLDWNETETTYPDQNTIQELFEQRVSVTPNSIAIEYEGEKLSYAELNSQANCLAHYLRKKGVTPETIVGLSISRSPKMIIGLLGILKSGAAYLPLDITYPSERLSYIIQDARVEFILTENSLIKQFSKESNNLIFLDSDWAEIQNENSLNPEIMNTSDNLAYVIYTSGSTGLPKGVLLQHQGLCNLAISQINYFKVCNSSRVLQFASFSFDASVSEVFMALISGATLVLAKQKQLVSISELANLLIKKKISVVTLPSSVLSVLPEKEYRHLQTLISAGETCSQRVASRWSKNLRFINAYGPTEITVSASSFVVDKINKISQSVPIGKPISNKKIYVLDEYFNPVPPGVIGELFIGGVGVARGYLNKPELTAEKFLPNPFNKTPGSRFYRTGDLVKYSKDGNLEFVGRMDYQVKVRGFRIELGEVEAILKRFELIQDAVVTVQEGEESSESRMIGYISHKPDYSVSDDEVKDYLKQYLPDYMIPSLIIHLDNFPLTASGKIDRTALPKPNILRDVQDFVAPKDELESRLVEIFEETLKIKPIGVTDNFFNVGGHSLLAVRLLAQIQKEFEKEITLVELFDEPTVKNLSRLIRSENINQAEVSDVLYKFHDSKNGKAPLFFIHPSGGTVQWYFQLAKEIGKNQPFYGIRAVGIDGKKEPHTRIEQMANYYVAAIQKRQPEGPYFIGSWSMGVIIAFEVAQQLASKGHKIARLFMFDQGPEIPNEKHEDDAEFLNGMFMGRLQFSLDKLRQMTYDEQLKYVLKTAKKAKQLPKVISLSQFKTYVSMLKVQQDAWRLYRPKKFPGMITLIKSEMKHEENTKFDLGWDGYTESGVEIHEVPGDHNTMLHKPNVAVLANKIRSLIDESNYE